MPSKFRGMQMNASQKNDSIIRPNISNNLNRKEPNIIKYRKTYFVPDRRRYWDGWAIIPGAAKAKGAVPGVGLASG